DGTPAVTPVTPYGATVDCQIFRRAFAGSISLPRLTARYVAWSARFHSHSRLLRNPVALGKVSLFSVVSIWKTVTCCPIRSFIRSYEWCMAEFGGSLNDREWRSVCTLWWWRRLR